MFTITSLFNRAFLPICFILCAIEMSVGVVYLITYTNMSLLYPDTNLSQTAPLENSVSKTTSTTTESISTSQPAKVVPGTVNLRTLMFGDVFWGRYINDWSQASSLKYSYPFSGLASFEKEKYDAWIADMECPVTDAVIDSPTQEATLSFNCNSQYLPEAAKWFDIFTLANNHTDNMETYNNLPFDGFSKTRRNMDALNIQYFGHFDNAKRADICEVVTIQDKKQSIDVPIAMCGFHNVFKLPLDEEVAVISEYAKYLPTFVFPHQGAEYQTVADDLQRSFARSYIDAGADAVIGDHVHVVQDTDVYNKKLIVYSLGNFIFDQQTGTTTWGTALDTSIEFVNDSNMQKLTEIGKNCKIFHDTCLSQIKQADLKKPQFTMKYDLIPTDNTGKLAKKATPEVGAQILRQARWNTTKSLLSR
jgi:hypothetical protein